MSGQPAALSQASAMTRGLVATTTGGAEIRRGVARAWRASGPAARAPFATFTPTNAGAGHAAAVIVLGAASGTAAVFPEHPHVGGGITVKLEVEGAPPAQATRAGKCLPAAGQGRLLGDKDLQ